MLGLEVTEFSQHGPLGFRQTGQWTRMQTTTKRLLLRRPFFSAQGRFTVVPNLEEFCTGSRPNETWMNQTGKAHARNVATRAINALNVPNGLGGSRVVIRQEATTIFLGKGSSETPFIAVEGAKVEKLDPKEVTLWRS